MDCSIEIVYFNMTSTFNIVKSLHNALRVQKRFLNIMNTQSVQNNIQQKKKYKCFQILYDYSCLYIIQTIVNAIHKSVVENEIQMFKHNRNVCDMHKTFVNTMNFACSQLYQHYDRKNNLTFLLVYTAMFQKLTFSRDTTRCLNRTELPRSRQRRLVFEKSIQHFITYCFYINGQDISRRIKEL